MKYIQTNVSDQQHQELKIIALKLGVSFQDLLKTIVLTWLTDYNEKGKMNGKEIEEEH